MDAETVDLQVGILRDMATTMRMSACELDGVVLADKLDAFCDRVGAMRVASSGAVCGDPDAAARRAVEGISA